MTPRMDIAKDAWAEVPVWLEALVRACDELGSQNKVAIKLGFSASVISSVLRNEYKGNMRNFEYRVRAVYMPDAVNCPAVGEIQSADCLDWQDEARSGVPSSSPIKVRMRKQCVKCPRYIEAGQL